MGLVPARALAVAGNAVMGRRRFLVVARQGVGRQGNLLFSELRPPREKKCNTCPA